MNLKVVYVNLTLRGMALAFGLTLSGHQSSAQGPEFALDPNQIDFYQVVQEWGSHGEFNSALQSLIPALSAHLEFPLTQQDFDKLLRRERAKIQAKQTGSFRLPPIKLSTLYKIVQDRALSEGLVDREGPNPGKQSLRRPLSHLVHDLIRPNLEFQAPTPKTLSSGLSMGHQDNPFLSADFKARSVILAEVLTRLSEGEATSGNVILKGHGIKTVRDLFVALGMSGRLTIDRTVADFASLNYKGQSIILPFWMDTEIRQPGLQETYVLPMGHSQITFRLEWPISQSRLAQTSVRYFLGTEGMKFYPMTTVRPRWTGFAVDAITDKREEVLTALSVSEALIARNRVEGRGLWRDGYGFTGVCNDSTAPLLALFNFEHTTFPVLRSQVLLQQGFPSLPDGMDQMVATLMEKTYSRRTMRPPQEGHSNRAKVLRKILFMRPTTGNSVYDTDPRLKRELESLSDEVTKDQDCQKVLL